MLLGNKWGALGAWLIRAPELATGGAPANHALAPCLPDHVPPARELWLVTRRQDDKEISIRTVIEFLMRIFDEERRLFEE